MVYIVTLGCPKNQVDSDNLRDMLSKKGIDDTMYIEQASLILINTCGFIHKAKEESVNEIFQYLEYKESGKRLVVFGCLAERYREDLESEIPEIDKIFGIGQEERIVAYCKEVQDMESILGSTHDGESVYESDILSPTNYAYLKIAEGCDRQCSFCVIPSIRGKYRSASPDDIIKKAEKSLTAGMKELIVIAQDITSYGKEIGYSLHRLIEDLASLSGDFWIRLLYLYPTALDDKLIEVLKSEEKVCKYLDIPLQHSEERILKAMGRGGSRSLYLDMINSLRSEISDLILRTSFIIGFPGETRDLFKGLLSFIEEAQFDRLGVFAYSDEEGTPAHGINGKVSHIFTQKRVREIMEVQSEISLNRNLEFKGRVFRALVDEVTEDRIIARLYSHAPEIDGNVIIHSLASVSFNDFIEVKITDASEHDLAGVLV